MLLPLLISIWLYLLGNNSLVVMNVTAAQSMILINVTLPIEPMGPIMVTNASDYPIPTLIVNNNLIIPATNGPIIIKYTPKVSILPNGLLSIDVSSPYPINLYVSNDVLLSSIPTNLIMNFTVTGNGYIIQLAPGNYTIGFMPQPSTAVNTNPTSAPKAINRVSGQGLPIYLILTVAVIVVILLVYLIMIKMRPKNHQ